MSLSSCVRHSRIGFLPSASVCQSSLGWSSPAPQPIVGPETVLVKTMYLPSGETADSAKAPQMPIASARISCKTSLFISTGWLPGGDNLRSLEGYLLSKSNTVALENNGFASTIRKNDCCGCRTGLAELDANLGNFAPN